MAIPVPGPVFDLTGRAALLKVTVPPALEELVLTDFGMSREQKKQLRAKFGARLTV